MGGDTKANIQLPETVTAILREADTTILALAGKSHHLLYRTVHRYAARLAHVDSFYVGFYMEETMMVFPYSFDGKAYYDPNKFPYMPNGVSATILRECQPYRHDQDGGKLLNMGKRFGEQEKLSQDCVVVPICKYTSGGNTPTAVGVIGVLSYEPGVYGDVEEKSFQWLADILSIVRSREQEDIQRRKALGLALADIQIPILHPEHVVNQMLEKMASLRRAAQRLREAAMSGASDLGDMAEDLYQECEQRQTETIELFLDSEVRKDSPMGLLTEAQRKVAAIFASGYYYNQTFLKDRDVAENLNISEGTVHSHRKSINQKLGISGRPGIKYLAILFFGNETATGDTTPP